MSEHKALLDVRRSLYDLATELNTRVNLLIGDINEALESRVNFACYCCTQRVSGEKVFEHTADGEPLCPYCSVDALVAEPISHAALSRLHELGFG